MGKQINFTDLEYESRRRTTKRQKLLDRLGRLLPWDRWSAEFEEACPSRRTGRPPTDPLILLKMFFLRQWFSLSDETVVDAVYDSYAMKSFLGINFGSAQVPDPSTLAKFRRRLKNCGLEEKITAQTKELLRAKSLTLRRGSCVDAVLIRTPKKKAGAPARGDQK